MNIKIWNNTKNWWKKQNREYALNSVPSIIIGDLSTKDWQEKIEKLEKLSEINNLGWKVKKEIDDAKSKLAFGAGAWGVKSFDEKELKSEIDKDIAELEREWKLLEAQNDTAKPMIEKYENAIKDFNYKIKLIVGDDPNDLTNWEKLVVKSGYKDKNITNLQKKVNDLNTSLTATQTEKNKIEQELKQKQDQWVNHECNNPNAQELNQVKDELKKANQEKERLQTELGQKEPNSPSPTSHQKEEEDQKDEQENQNLTVEELRAKLNSKQQAIRDLQKQLEKTKQNSSQSTQNSKSKSKFLLGMIVGFSIVAVIGGIVYFLRFYKNKKKKKTVKLVYEAKSNFKRSPRISPNLPSMFTNS